MINIERLCKNCMQELPADGQVCPHCGFDSRKKPQRPVASLPEQTILKGRYMLGPVLGQGGFGITYLAVDLQSERRVAVKEYFPAGLVTRTVTAGPESFRENPQDRNFTEYIHVGGGDQETHFRNGMRRFQREAATLMELIRLDGIVHVSDFFEENGTAYMVMDYIPGIPLKRYMAERKKKTGKPFSWEEALRLIEPVMTALSEVHRAGIVHRDVSPDNILVSFEENTASAENPTVTLIDFGSSKEELAALSNKSTTIMVKHGYAPEEQYRTHGLMGAWTDIYALCGTLYHMIAGTLPTDAIERMMQDTLVPLKILALDPPVPAEISDVVEKGMKIRARDRYQSIEEMRTDLNKAIAAEEMRREEQRRKEAEERLAAARKAEEAAKRAEEAKKEAARKAEEAKKAEEAARKAEEAKKAEEEKQKEAARKAEEEKQKEAARKAAEEKNRQEAQKISAPHSAGKKIGGGMIAAGILLLALIAFGILRGRSGRNAGTKAEETASGQQASGTESEENASLQETSGSAKETENKSEPVTEINNMLFDESVYRGNEIQGEGSPIMSAAEAAAIRFTFDEEDYREKDYSDGRKLSDFTGSYKVSVGEDPQGPPDETLSDHLADLVSGLGWSSARQLQPYETEPYFTVRFAGIENEHDVDDWKEKQYYFQIYTPTPRKYYIDECLYFTFSNYKNYNSSDNGYQFFELREDTSWVGTGFVKDGEVKIFGEFHEFGWFSEGLAPVKDSRWGFLDENGTVVIPFIFQSVGVFRSGLAPVVFEDDDEIRRYGYINTEGKLVYVLSQELADQVTDALFYSTSAVLGPVREDGSFYIGFYEKKSGYLNHDTFMEELKNAPEDWQEQEQFLEELLAGIKGENTSSGGFLYKVVPGEWKKFEENEILTADFTDSDIPVDFIENVDELSALWAETLSTEDGTGLVEDLKMGEANYAGVDLDARIAASYEARIDSARRAIFVCPESGMMSGVEGDTMELPVAEMKQRFALQDLSVRYP